MNFLILVNVIIITINLKSVALYKQVKIKSNYVTDIALSIQPLWEKFAIAGVPWTHRMWVS
ncbi:hypothetical protein GCM10022410_15520 [Amphibacillus indicireducens]|uniref:Uncharacterized protein n=1 Tax=Amphibacillus indicireducens TaxID=1076330 RepID=A0ABP7VNB5_9BACI